MRNDLPIIGLVYVCYVLCVEVQDQWPVVRCGTARDSQVRQRDSPVGFSQCRWDARCRHSVVVLPGWSDSGPHRPARPGRALLPTAGPPPGPPPAQQYRGHRWAGWAVPAVGVACPALHPANVSAAAAHHLGAGHSGGQHHSYPRPPTAPTGLQGAGQMVGHSQFPSL